MNMKSLLVSTLSLFSTLGVATADPLIVYSQFGGEVATWITEKAKENGHEIQMLRGEGGGSLFDRLIAEKNNPQADIVLGLVDFSMAQLVSEGLFQPYTPTWSEGLPERYSDSGGYVWKFFQTPIVLAYNTDVLSEDAAPTSWLDLVKPEYEGKYVIGRMGSGTTRTYLAGMLARFMDENGDVSQEGWDFMTTFFQNGLVGVDKAETFKVGEAYIDLNHFNGAFRFADNVGYTTKLIDTEGGTPVISEGVAILASTEHFDEAKAFIDWWGSIDTMVEYANQFNRLVAHPDAIAQSPQIVKERAALVSAQTINWDIVAGKMDSWMEKIELEIR